MRARQKVSRAGVELIKSFEGLRQTAARLPDGRWTIGYGHTFSAREGARVTQEDADALLRFDLLPIVDSLNNMILVPVNQNQFDALVSFSFNIGIENFGSSSVLKRINEGRMTEAALAMDAWRSAEFNGQTYVLAPLIRRRAAEKNLFLTPEDNVANASSLLVRPLADVEADAASARPSELDAPDRGGVLSAYPAGHAQPFAPPATQTFVPETPAAQPVFQPTAPQPVTPLPVASQPTPVETAPVEPQPIPQPAAVPQLSPYAAATYVSEAATPTLPLSPYAGIYTPPAAPQPVAPQPVAPQPAAPQPEFVAPPAAQPVSYDRQFIDLTSITPRPLPETAPAPVQAAPQPVAPQPAVSPPVAPQPVMPQPILQPSDFSPYSSVASPYVSPYAQPVPQPVAPQPVAPQPVLRPSDISPYPPAASPYISPYAQPVPQPAAPQPVTPSPAAFATGEPPVVEMLPGGFATPSQIRETPVQTPEPAAPTAFDPAFGSAMMSPEVAAALARAQGEQRQRDEAERLAQQAAARAAEEARIRELQRQEAERLEQQRQEQDRFERARLDAERQERERAEAARLEQARLEQERADQARAEQARIEQERLERDRAEQARLEAERLERERAEQARVEQARLEAERVERERQAATATATAAAAAVATAAVAGPTIDEAEKARKAEAAAALMRLYSPYGGGPLGRPLGFGSAPITQANLTPSPEAQSSDTASVPKPEAPQAAEPEPEAAKRPVDEFVAQSVIAPATAAPIAGNEAEDEVPVFSTRVETRNDEDEDVSSFRPFTPIMSAANMPAPIVTALNPYASPLPQAAVREATETVVEVPRPEPVVMAPVAAPVQAEPLQAEPIRAALLHAEPESAPEGLHWRERLQRPLPADHQPTAPDFAAPERQASLLPKAAYAGEYDDTHAVGEDWLHDGRIAMSTEEMEEHTVSWWRMLLSTFWWIMLSMIGIISLGVAAGAYYKSRDLSVIRNGLQQDMEAVSIVTAVIGFVLVSTSMWLMMRRLGGLKEQ